MPYSPRYFDFNLTVGAYTPSSNFNLGGDVGPPGTVYPIPPSIMSTVGISSVPAGVKSYSRNVVDYARALGRQSRLSLASNNANVVADAKAPQQWGKVPAKDDGIAAGVQPWGASGKHNSRASEGWQTVPVKDQAEQQGIQSWDGSALPTDARASQPHNLPLTHDVTGQYYQSDSAQYWEQPEQQEAGGYIPQNDFNLSGGAYSPPGALVVDFNLQPEQAITVIDVPTRPVDSGLSFQGWNTNTALGLRIKHPWDTKPRKGTEVNFDYDAEPSPPPVIPPDVKKSYVFMNASSLTTLAENAPLDFQGFSASIDIDSIAWDVSFTILNPQSMDLIRPSGSGPAEVEAVVNGHSWRFMVEQYTLNKTLQKDTYSVSGTSLTQLLGSPYSAGVSDQITTDTNALQVAQGLLQYTGFDIEWGDSVPDYTIPAGAWGYDDKTPIDVIGELVKASGGILQPHPSQSKLIAKHRYELSAPWHWEILDKAFIDAFIPDTLSYTYSSSWEPAADYNGVYVSGITHGVAVDVRRNGTVGDLPAPDVYDNLNLSTQQCRARGESILGQSGNQEVVTVEIPIPTSGSPGLVLPGMLIEYQITRDTQKNWRGLVLQTTVTVAKPGGSRATQTLKIERHHY